ncbi:hypothetical protein VCUG_00054 [Vavraia culicis subsp. floridensis]|uniref:Uncharacterized protein n=1 Tax=Vavraia culicis (isolate floridensis) TaxID=948595 RepID=L2GZE8_VAVCU|nr:uncharacterized protein VCUG_00054 [Vavraia culicis subsp. floridensis]ELA48445.1 hypothetical protein VCUG_00054 [Vavraia culicis subsp. floridensis]
MFYSLVLVGYLKLRELIMPQFIAVSLQDRIFPCTEEETLFPRHNICKYFAAILLAFNHIYSLLSHTFLPTEISKLWILQINCYLRQMFSIHECTISVCKAERKLDCW